MAANNIPESIRQYAKELGKTSNGAERIVGFKITEDITQLAVFVRPGSVLERMTHGSGPIVNNVGGAVYSLVHVHPDSDELKIPKDAEILYQEAK